MAKHQTFMSEKGNHIVSYEYLQKYKHKKMDCSGKRSKIKPEGFSLYIDIYYNHKRNKE